MDLTHDREFWNDYASKADGFMFDAGSHSVEYNGLAVLEEIGELAGKFAKAVRGDAPLAEWDVLQEVGDIIFNVSVRNARKGFKPFTSLDVNPVNGSIASVLRDLSNRCEEGGARWNVEPPLKFVLEGWGPSGATLESAATANLYKLESRKRRGVIKGNGDHR